MDVSDEKVAVKPVFDKKAADEMIVELRNTFGSRKTRSYEWRVGQLKSLFKFAEEREKEIADALYSDLNKSLMEAVIHEISLVKVACKVALKQLKNWMKPEKVKTPITTFPSTAEIVSEPLGVILVISAWNFPFLLSLDPVIGAIAAGNTVVLKPSEVAPATSSVLAKYLPLYMDISAIRVVEGGITESTLLLEQKWDKILYTGNSRVGRIVMAAAAKHLTPVVLELGGKSPVVVDSDINVKVAIRRIISGKWGCNNGQACVAPDYIITTKKYAPFLIESLKHQLVEFYGQDALKSNELSRIVNLNHFSRLKKLLDDDEVSGRVVYGGQTDKGNLKIVPTILLDVPQESLIMKEEIFGPLLPIITVEKVEDSFDLINSKPKPLAAYLFTNNKKLEEEFVSKVYAGGIGINETVLHTTLGTLPFGGVGESGMGVYHGKFSFDAFSHKKAVLHRNFLGDADTRYPPYTPWKINFLKSFVEGNILGVIFALFGWSKS